MANAMCKQIGFSRTQFVPCSACLKQNWVIGLLVKKTEGVCRVWLPELFGILYILERAVILRAICPKLIEAIIHIHIHIE